MVMIEMQESSYNKLMDLAENAIASAKRAKLDICDLYECLCECMEDTEEDERGDENYASIDNVEVGEINYRNNMRKLMRDDAMEMRMRNNMRSGMRGGMRSGMRHKMGRYSY